MSRTIEETIEVGDVYGETLYVDAIFDVRNETVEILSVYWVEETDRPNGLPKAKTRHLVSMGSVWMQMVQDHIEADTDWSEKSSQWADLMGA